MAADKATFYRSRHGVIAGVCAGIAAYYHTDVTFVRILTAVVACFSFGSVLLVYLALWLLIPLEPPATVPYDVRPVSISSDIYESVIDRVAPDSPRAPTGGGSGHVPPPPPIAGYTDRRRAATSRAQMHSPQSQMDASQSFMYVHGNAAEPASQASSCTHNVCAPIPPYVPAVSAQSSSTDATHERRVVCGGLLIGVIVAVCIVSMILSALVPAFAAWQFWAMIVIAWGIVLIVVPTQYSHEQGSIVAGIMITALGLLLLFWSLGFMVINLGMLFSDFWPLLLISMLLLIMGNYASRGSVLVALGCVAFVLFCLLAVLFCSVPGPTQLLWVQLPNNAGLFLDVLS